MATVESLFLTDLLLDLQNPRLDPQENQRQAILAMIEMQGTKLVALATDIVNNGINISELPIVMPAEATNKYVVLEGNRRVLTLKMLSTPELLEGFPLLSRRFSNLGKLLNTSVVSEIVCSVVVNRQEAAHWIELRHTGENEGAGIVRWGGTESARFASSVRGVQSSELQLLDYIKQQDPALASRLSNVPITNLKRLIDDPSVRDFLGITLTKDEIQKKYDDNELMKPLRRIINDLSSGQIKVSDIDNKKQRADYIASFLADERPEQGTSKATTTSSQSSSSIDAISQESPKISLGTATSKKVASVNLTRNTLIPKGCVLRIKDTRTNKIYKELKGLSCDTYPNATAVLFRVFLELSVDTYITTENITKVTGFSPLGHKIQAVADDIKNQGRMTDQQLQPVRKSVTDQSLLASSVKTMHDYVHNSFFSPIPNDLKISWDNLQLFVQTIWRD